MRKISLIVAFSFLLINSSFQFLYAEDTISEPAKTAEEISAKKSDTTQVKAEPAAKEETKAEVAESPKPEKTVKAKYIGAKECGVCHDGEKMGNIYTNWQQQGHARAFQRLKGSDKTNPNCLKCHTTGYGGEKLYEEVNLEGVQCEACHGPGSLYRPMPIMEDRKKSNDLGLIFPIDPMVVCKKCHLHRQDRPSPLCPGRD